MFKKKLGFLAGVMVLLSLAGYLLCLLAGDSKQLNKEEFLLVTSFYPMYVLAENLTDGVAGVGVSNLTENQTGCLHDYQLRPEDMQLLEHADAFLINGAGMELFMERVMEKNTGLTVIEASHGIDLLEAEGHHHHTHGDEEEAEHDEHDHEEHAGNGHVWMDVERYRKQLDNVTQELIRLMPEQEEALQRASAVYEEKLVTLSEEVMLVKELSNGMPVVIFHEAFAYLAESLGMEVLAEVSLDENTMPSPGELAELIEEIKYHGKALILIEEAHKEYADKIMAETDAKTVYLDPLTTGEENADSYLLGMQNNLDAIREVLK